MKNSMMTLVLISVLFSCHSQGDTYDIVIYGGTSGGCAAAIQAVRMDKSVVLIEPGRRIGGLTTGGLGQTDIGNKMVIGGISRDFYRGIKAHYELPASWKFQTREQYRDGGQTRTSSGEDAMWTFEPSAALTVMERMLADAGVPVVYGERLERSTGVQKDGASIMSIVMESGRTFHGSVFIDATYEGDLMASAGVSYRVGREANSEYGETCNGVQTVRSVNHNLMSGIDPYIVPGDSSSGLLPGIDPDGPGEEYSGDRRIQAYCYRMCLTDAPENRIPFHKPDGYDELRYELLFRNYEAGEKGFPWINSAMPNRKTDTNNRRGFSTDFIGRNYDYPEADYADRERIKQEHLVYQQGLMWTLANHPRIPEQFRTEFARWGVTKDEFTDNGGWPDQMYIREARRMTGAVVMTEHHCRGEVVAEDPVGMGAYNMDSHNTQRYVDANGHARNEGNIEERVPPYPVSYWAMVPKAEECTNLIVPVCLSATHIAFGSIRMEPVFMVLGQSAATAAAFAINDGVHVQDVEYSKLRERLLADGQVLEYRPE